MANQQGVMAPKPKSANLDDELGDVSNKDEVTKVAFEFPKDVDPEVVKNVINKMGDLTASEMDKKRKRDAGREEYMKNGHRRFKCIVRSLRPEINYFETYFPDPSNPETPIRCEVRCGVVIEDGLTQYVIDCINYEHHYETRALPADYSQSMGLTAQAVRVPHYSVEILGEVANPKPVGTIGHGPKR